MKNLLPKFLLAFLAIVLFVTSAWATDVTIQSYAIGWSGPTSDVEIRFFLVGDGTTTVLRTPESQVYRTGTPANGTTTFKWDCTVASGQLTIPSVTLPATTNAVGGGRVRWQGVFFRKTAGTSIQEFADFTFFQLPHYLPSPVTWFAIKNFNSSLGTETDLTKPYGRGETDQKIAAALASASPGAVPSRTGHAGEFLYSDGTNATWLQLGANGTLLDPNVPTTLTGKTLLNPTLSGTIGGVLGNSNLPSNISGKTLSTATIPSPTISGTVAGGATYNAPVLVTPTISGTVPGNVTVGNTLTAAHLVGDCSGCTGLGNVGGLINPGATTVGANSDSSGNESLVLQTKATTRLSINDSLITATLPFAGFMDRGGEKFNVKAFVPPGLTLGTGVSQQLSTIYPSLAAAKLAFPNAGLGKIWQVDITDPGQNYGALSGLLPITGGGGSSAFVKWYAAVGQVTSVPISTGGKGYSIQPRRVRFNVSGTTCHTDYGPGIIDFELGGAAFDEVVAAKVFWSGVYGCDLAPLIELDPPDLVEAVVTTTTNGSGVPSGSYAISFYGLGYGSGVTATIPGCSVQPTFTITTLQGHLNTISSTGGSGCPTSQTITLSIPTNGVAATATTKISGITETYVVNGGTDYDSSVSAMSASVSGAAGGSGATFAVRALDLTSELDEVAIQEAVESLVIASPMNGGEIFVPSTSGAYMFRKGVKLPAKNDVADWHFRLSLVGENSTLQTVNTVTNTTILSRSYPGLEVDTDVASNGASIPNQRIGGGQGWKIKGFIFENWGGGMMTNNRAINVDSLMRLQVINNYFNSWATAFEGRFLLLTTFQNNGWTNNYGVSLYQHYNDFQGFNFASNVTADSNSRYYAGPGSTNVRYLASSEYYALKGAHEGNAPKYAIELDPIGHPTSVLGTVIDTHFEANPQWFTPYTAIRTRMFGMTKVIGAFAQWGSTKTTLTLVDSAGAPGGTQILVEDFPSLPGRLNFRGDTNSIYEFKNVGNVPWDNPPSPVGTSYYLWDTQYGAVKPTNITNDSLSYRTNRSINKLSIDQLAMGANVQAAEVFRIESQGKTGHINPFMVDSASAYNLSFGNRDHSASVVAGIYVGNNITGGSFNLEALGARQLNLWANGAIRLTADNTGVTVPGLTASRAVVTGTGGLLQVSATTAAEIAFVNGATSNIQTQLNNKQALDATLTALAAFNTNGLIVQTAPDTFAARTLTGTANQISVADGDGVSGNPTLSLPSTLIFPGTFKVDATNGATVTGILKGTATLNFDLSATACQDLTITVTGAAVGDAVALGAPNGSITTDTNYVAWVSATNTVTVRACRLSGTPDPASGTFTAWVIK